MASMKRKSVIKFVLLLAVLVGYFVYLSYEYDIATGSVGALLSWSFFVLCTPIADAGILLDLPIRLLFGIRMVFSELVVWSVAGLINILTFWQAESYYDTTTLTHMLHTILTTPMPYWWIICLSMIGTFLSLMIGDTVVDITGHKGHGRLLNAQSIIKLGVFVSLFVALLVGYYFLIMQLDDVAAILDLS